MLVIQCGQAGNQVGHEFWKMMAKSNKKDSTFFKANGKARCILVDSEPKVVQHLLNDIKKGDELSYPKENVFYEQSGCGNNWALGYWSGGNMLFSQNKKNVLLEKTMEKIQMEIDSDDLLKGIIVFHSLSGGTGSGLGCRICEEIKKKYGDQLLLYTVSVTSFLSGDTPMQYYNQLLSLAHLQQYVDCAILFSNETISTIISKSLTDSTQTSKYSSKHLQHSTQDINRYIASCLFGLLAPIRVPVSVNSNDGSIKYEIKSFDPFELIRMLCPTPTNKFVEIYSSSTMLSSSKQFTAWRYICQNFMKKIPHFSMDSKSKITTVSSYVIVRGESVEKSDEKEIVDELIDNLNLVLWNPEPICMKFSKQNEKILDNQPTIVCALNRSTVIEFFNQICTKSWLMLETDAYICWYEKHKCSRETFFKCFEIMKQCILDYCYLSRG